MLIMRHIYKFLLTTGILATSFSILPASVFGYSAYSGCPSTYTDESDYFDSDFFESLPQAPTRVQPNGVGGYTWYETPSKRSKNAWENLPKKHTIDPDGSGGYRYYCY